MGSRLYGYNSGAPVSGASQSGNLAISNDSRGGGSVQWFNGPNEDLGYVICRPNTSGNQPNPDNVPAYIRFSRSKLKTDQSFINLVNSKFGQNFTAIMDATNWLDSSGYFHTYTY